MPGFFEINGVFSESSFKRRHDSTLRIYRRVHLSFIPDINIRISMKMYLFLTLVLGSAVLGQEGKFVNCCQIAKAQRAYLNKGIPQNDYTCGPTFNSHKAPACDMEVQF